MYVMANLTLNIFLLKLSDVNKDRKAHHRTLLDCQTSFQFIVKCVQKWSSQITGLFLHSPSLFCSVSVHVLLLFARSNFGRNCPQFLLHSWRFQRRSYVKRQVPQSLRNWLSPRQSCGFSLRVWSKSNEVTNYNRHFCQWKSFLTCS